MNEENKQSKQPNSDPADNADGSSTSAQPVKKGWQMPEPKFQQTSGYLPQGYLDEVNEAGGFAQKPGITTLEPKTGQEHKPEQLPDDFSDVAPPGDVIASDPDHIGNDGVEHSATDDPVQSNALEAVEPMPEPEAVPDVEPQPDLLDAPEEVSTVAVAPVAPKKGGMVSTLLFVLFFIGLGVLALIVVAIAYYLFLADSGAGRTF